VRSYRVCIPRLFTDPVPAIFQPSTSEVARFLLMDNSQRGEKEPHCDFKGVSELHWNARSSLL